MSIRSYIKAYIIEDIKQQVKYGVMVASGVYLIYCAGKYTVQRYKARSMRIKGAQKNTQKLLKALPMLNLPDESKKQYILSLKAYEIVKDIESEKITPEEVLHTYIERAYKLGRKFNISAEEPFEDAISRLASATTGLLRGVPISIKDEILQESCHSSGGVAWLGQTVDPGDSILISQLRKSGAIPFIRGNAMQLMKWFETVNNIYGKAENPWDPKRTPGGSSGGDAGLVASGATPLAIGGDIAGSIRIPAAFCGIYGFKPSSKRITCSGCVGTHPKSTTPLALVVKASFGPLGRCVEDLVLVVKSWWEKALWQRDNMVVPLVFNDSEYESTKRLKIGYFDYDNVFECAGVVKKAIRSTVAALSQAGHELIPMRTDMFPKAVELFIRATYSIGNSYIMEELQGEDPVWTYKKDYYESRFFFAEKLIKAYKKLTGYRILAHYMSFAKKLTYQEFCILAQEIQDFKYEFNEYWQSLKLDAAVCPIWPLVAPYHETTVKLAHAFSYSIYWNLLDFPAGVVPVKKVEKGENRYEYFSTDSFVKVAQDNMKSSEGLPVCVQVVGSTYQDEKVLRVMKIIQDHFGFHELAKVD